MDVIDSSAFALFSVAVVYFGMKIDEKLQQRAEKAKKRGPPQHSQSFQKPTQQLIVYEEEPRY